MSSADVAIITEQRMTARLVSILVFGMLGWFLANKINAQKINIHNVIAFVGSVVSVR